MTAVVAWRGVFALVFVIVTWLTLTPNPDETKPAIAIARWIARRVFGDETLGDKVAHVIAYAALGASAAFARLQLFGRRAFAILALGLYGAALEATQGIGGVRTPELADALSNMAGALAGFPLALAAERLAPRKSGA